MRARPRRSSSVLASSEGLQLSGSPPSRTPLQNKPRERSRRCPSRALAGGRDRSGSREVGPGGVRGPAGSACPGRGFPRGPERARGARGPPAPGAEGRLPGPARRPASLRAAPARSPRRLGAPSPRAAGDLRARSRAGRAPPTGVSAPAAVSQPPAGRGPAWFCFFPSGRKLISHDEQRS